MNISADVLMAVLAVVTLAASIIALYVSLRFKAELASLQTALDDRYVRIRDAKEKENAVQREENSYRESQHHQIEDVRTSIKENIALIKEGTTRIEALLEARRKE